MSGIDFTMINEFASPLKNFAFHFTHDREDAEDLYQDTIVKAIRYSAQFREGTNLRAWLFTIMRNTFINDYRKAMKKGAVIQQVEDLSSMNLLSSAQTNGAVSKFAFEDINKALAKVPSSYRIAFIKYFEGYKYEEIASEMNIPIGTVKTRIHQARTILKKQLKHYR